jgi:predicted ATP-grasp superfamily ATP-dependent carboligase
LVKPVCSEGGKGVGFCSKNRLTPNAYYQREVSGEAYSLLFLANGKTIRRIGFNTQWTSSHNPAQPFLFAGIINRAELTEAQRQSVERHAAQLTEATGLLGLNSLDFMLADGVCRVLENNPRPSASMALYDEDYAGGLLALHIAACRGDLPPQASAPSGPVRASRLVFCQAPVSIPVGFSWPKGCADIPAPRTKIEIGQPICRLQVETTSRPEAEALLQAQERDVQRGLDTRNDAAENAEMLAEVD